MNCADIATQYPEPDEGSLTMNARLGNAPKIVSDFAVRGLEFPRIWVPFVKNIPAEFSEISVWDPLRVNEMILAIYYNKVLVEDENPNIDNIYQMTLLEYVVLHFLELFGEDFDAAKAAFRDFLYGVIEHMGRADRFRLFFRFCDIKIQGQEPLPDLILEYYLCYLMEVNQYVVKPKAKDG